MISFRLFFLCLQHVLGVGFSGEKPTANKSPINKTLLRGTIPMPCRQLTLPYRQGSWRPCFFASGCNYDGVISPVQRVASA
jgi:hypothetical protein